ncbi:MAG TPA: DUF4041 domain-containing protein [Bacteroidia bacterium]|nr:DUF4041 domain-containing protein [Bacteroidia bacterium]
MIAAITILLLFSGSLGFILYKKAEQLRNIQTELRLANTAFNSFKERYIHIVDIAGAVAAKSAELEKLREQLSNLEPVFAKQKEELNAEFASQKEQLNFEFQSKRNVYEQLLKEISILEENLENISYGLYEPHYEYATSEAYKKRLEQIRENQKQMIKSEQATYCPIEWTVGDSRAKGIKMVKEASKIMLRAFNGECDAAIAKVSWNNISTMETRIQKSFEALNKLGSTNHLSITPGYLQLKLQELYLEFEAEEKIYKEKEEQRKIREQMREEEKALREMEKAAKDAEAEEMRYEKALEKAKSEISKLQGAELDKLAAKIKDLELNLQNAHERKERAISQAQLTKSGHVYIISNIGSFGEHIYKIGMTRRLEPMDRVDELGDASVPFDFDVHGMIYSEDAPGLENLLHKRLENKRLNLVNRRAEFFQASIDEIEEIIKEFNLTIQLTKLAEAREYRETLSLREASKNVNTQPDPVKEKLEIFPAALN